MFYHRCGNNLYANISSSVLLLVTFTLTRDGLKPAHLELINKEKGNERINFFCPSCNREVTIDEIYVYCMNCGKQKSILGESGNRIYNLSRSGGVYCESCCNLYFPEEDKVEVKNLISKVRFD